MSNSARASGSSQSRQNNDISVRAPPNHGGSSQQRPPPEWTQKDSFLMDPYFRLEAAKTRALIHFDQLRKKQRSIRRQDPSPIVDSDLIYDQDSDSDDDVEYEITPHRDSNNQLVQGRISVENIDYDVTKSHLLFDLHSMIQELRNIQDARAYLTPDESSHYPVKGWLWTAVSTVIGTSYFVRSERMNSQLYLESSSRTYLDWVIGLFSTVATGRAAAIALHYQCLKRLIRKITDLGRTVENDGHLDTDLRANLTGFEWVVLRWF